MTCPKANTSHDSAEGEFHEYDVDAGETDRDKIYGIKNRIVKCSEDAARTFINEMREQKKSAHIMHDPFEDKTPGPPKNIPLECDDRNSRSRRGRSCNPWPLVEAA